MRQWPSSDLRTYRPTPSAFRRLESFLGDDVRLAVLRVVSPELIVRNADVMLAAIGQDGGLLHRIAYLDAFLGAMFAGETPAQLGDLQRRTLHAVAAMLDAHSGFVNLLEVVRSHGIPTDSFAVREWAEGRSASAAKPVVC
ncbi:MAG: hypothetical protein J0I07_18635 [Myxococcales bacterium]|nr:hypothetical protein [Myxococcales bacterium]